MPAVAYDVAAGDEGELGRGLLLVLHGRALPEVFELRLGEAVAAVFVHAAEAAGADAAAQELAVRPAYIHAAVRPGQLGGEARVVGVQVREEEVGLIHADAELPEPGRERLAALAPAKARVYDEAAPPVLNYIGVERAQRVLRQGHGYGVYVPFDVFVHGLSPFLCV